MKKFAAIIIVLVIIGVAGIAAYQMLDDKIPSKGKTLTSDDNKYSMEIPSSWTSAQKANAISVLAAENRSSSMYALLSVNPYMTDGATVEDYINAYITDIANNSDDPTTQKILTAPKQETFGENIGYYFELESHADGLTVMLRCFVFATNDGYVHIDVVSPINGGTDSENIAMDIISSVKYSADGNVS